MTQTELEQVLSAILRRGDPAYTTPSDAFLEYLSSLAVQLNIEVLAQACAAYVAAFPTSTHFIAARIPGILCNRYFSTLPDFDYEKFIQWSVKNPGWEVPIERGFSSAIELVAAISFIRQQVKQSA